MNLKPTLDRYFAVDLYKCLVLTVIAGTLIAILSKMPPQPLTWEAVRTQKLKGWKQKLPLIGVGAGEIEIEGTVDVSGTVTVDNTVEVHGEVRIER